MVDYFEPINDLKSSDDLTGNAFRKLFSSESKRYKPGTQKILQSINKNLMESFELDRQTTRNVKMLQLQQQFFEKKDEIKTVLQDAKTSNNNLFETKGYQEYKQYVDNTNSRPNSIPISAPNSNDYSELVGSGEIERLNVSSTNRFGVNVFDEVNSANQANPVTSTLSNLGQSVGTMIATRALEGQSVGTMIATRALDMAIPGAGTALSIGLTASSMLRGASDQAGTTSFIENLPSTIFSGVAGAVAGIATRGIINYGISKLFGNEDADGEQDASNTEIDFNPISAISDFIGSKRISNDNKHGENENGNNSTKEIENNPTTPAKDNPDAQPYDPNTGPEKPTDPTESSLLPDEYKIEKKVQLAPTRLPLDLPYNATNALAYSSNTSASRQGYSSNFKRRKF